MVNKNILAILICFLITSCLNYDFSRRIVQQGNLIPQDKIQQLQIGMSKTDAASILGTSLLSPLFNQNRWDYAYTYRRGSGALKVKSISLYFLNDKLKIIYQNN